MLDPEWFRLDFAPFSQIGSFTSLLIHGEFSVSMNPSHAERVKTAAFIQLDVQMDLLS